MGRLQAVADSTNIYWTAATCQVLLWGHSSDSRKKAAAHRWHRLTAGVCVDCRSLGLWLLLVLSCACVDMYHRVTMWCVVWGLLASSSGPVVSAGLGGCPLPKYIVVVWAREPLSCLPLAQALEGPLLGGEQPFPLPSSAKPMAVVRGSPGAPGPVTDHGHTAPIPRCIHEQVGLYRHGTNSMPKRDNQRSSPQRGQSEVLTPKGTIRGS